MHTWYLESGGEEMGGWSEEKKMAKAKSPRAMIEREKNKHWVVCSPTGEAVVDGVDG